MQPATFDLRAQIQHDGPDHLHAHADAAAASYTDDDDTSVIDDDHDEHDDYVDDDDGSSSLSIPNESIDFDLVYSLHSFAATVEGQANVVKGDSLFLMDDSNSYWWLVRVLKTQEVGYIPAENIETPFERLARLNKHRNVDLASPTQAELNESIPEPANDSPSPLPLGARAQAQVHGRNIRFGGPRFGVLHYPRAIWREDEAMEVDTVDDDSDWVEFSEHEDAGLAEEHDLDDAMNWEEPPPALRPGGTRQPQSPLPAPIPAEQQQQQQYEEPIVEAPPLRTSSSREQLVDESHRPIDPAEATETRKLTMTPTIAQSEENKPYSIPNDLQQQPQAAANLKGKMAAPVSSASLSKPPSSPSGKLRKERESDDESGGGKEKKKRGMFIGLFKSKKDKKDKHAASSAGSSESGDSLSRVSVSEDAVNRPSTSTLASDSIASPTTATAMQQQQQQALNALRAAPGGAVDPPQTPERLPAAVSQHASQLRQRDQQQQALYTQQYLTRSPSSPPETQLQPSYGLQSASALSAYHSPLGLGLGAGVGVGAGAGPGSGLGPPAPRARPGSLILTPGLADAAGLGVGAGGVPTELSVIRVFAGWNLRTEATFKTVLLSSGTTSEELIRQATQRFRLSPAPGAAPGEDGEGEGEDGEGEGEYYLTVKQVEGGAFAVLRPEEKPLVVFEQLVEEAMEMPKVKRSSVGSISSVASNLSMHPAIRKLAMNDFTDDSAVKFYLNRRGRGGVGREEGYGFVQGGYSDGHGHGHGHGHEEGDDTLVAESSFGDVTAPAASETPLRLVASATALHNVTPERFTSPSVRFALQLVIYPEDLPEDMVFHPQTEAIVFRDTLRDRDRDRERDRDRDVDAAHMRLRRKVFVFPKNATVAEVIELGLERFGISEGVVDGGDEVEDKSVKRRSATRVRYGLCVSVAGASERELAPSSRVIEAFPRPPPLKAIERPTPTSKRRSVDSSLVLGAPDDVGPDDPVFVLRRAMTYRNSTSRHRMSAPLDELALHHLHRDSTSSASASVSVSLADPASHSYSYSHLHEREREKPSRQEIIARQREASRATQQRAILSAQTNPYRGMDVLLPGNTMLRSSRYDTTDRMRYSYVDTDGEVYDISDIVEEELAREPAAMGGGRSDLLEGVLGRRDVVGEKLNRVLSKIRGGGGGGKVREAESEAEGEPEGEEDARRSRSISEYSVDTDTAAFEAPPPRGTSPLRAEGAKSKTPTPTPTAELARASPGSAPAVASADRPRTGTPAGAERRQPSVASVMSDISGYATPPPARSVEIINEDDDEIEMGGGGDADGPRSAPPSSQSQQRRLVIPQDDFGVAHMLSIIEYKDAKPRTPLPPLDPVDALLFGRPLDLQALHPKIRDIYAPTFKQLEEMDKILDDYLGHVLTNP